MREALLRLVAEHALEIDARGRISVPHLTRAELLEVRKLRGFLKEMPRVKPLSMPLQRQWTHSNKSTLN